MSECFISEIRMFGGNFAPIHWALCDGQLLPIAQNPALFSLIGAMYGGDGKTTFALPDLRGRLPLHRGQAPGGGSYQQGARLGVEAVTLTLQDLPAHNHAIQTSANVAAANQPSGNVLAETDASANQAAYQNTLSNAATLNPQSVGLTGGGMSHNNMMPSLGVSFIIALTGYFPSRN
ncbi:MAG: phage tail protein [Methylohalobius sp. ZOD2]|nr:phage tail protein [Methylothermaceae bacterium]